MASGKPQVLLAQAYPAQEALLVRALTAHGVHVATVPPYAHLETEIARAARAQPAPLLVVVDLAVLAQLSTSLAASCGWLQSHCAGARLMATCGGQIAVQPQERAWARRCGAVDLLPGSSGRDPARHLLPVLAPMLAELGLAAADEEKLAHAIAAPAGKGALPSPADVACEKLARLATLGVPATGLVTAMQGANGVEVAERIYHLVPYPECFVGASVVDWMVRECGVTRQTAVEAGALLLELGLIYHVAREQPFADGPFYYRFSASLDDVDLAATLERLRGPSGVAIEDRTYRGVTYPACFVGADAVAWLATQTGLSVNRALTLGQRLVDLSIIHHVLDEHPFKDGFFFYRFYADERRA